MARIANKLIRQISRHLGDGDAADRMHALAIIMAERPDLFKEYAPLAQGFPAFLESIQESYAQYEDKNKMAIRNLQLSSEELNEVNRKLEFLNISINAMLESLGEGLLFFDRAGLCSHVFSKSCHAFLESNPGGRYIWDVLDLNELEAKNFRELICYIDENNSAMSFQDLMSLAPQFKLRSDGRKLGIEYRSMSGFGGDAQGVLVIITDLTESEKTRKLIEEKENTAGYILRLAKNRSGFQQFIKDARQYFLRDRDSGYILERDIKGIRAAIHTFKGLAGIFYADDLALELHALEDDIRDKNVDEAKDIVTRHEPKIAELCQSIENKAEALFGANFMAHGETKTISVAKMNSFYAQLLEKGCHESVIKAFLQDFLAVSVHDKLESLDYYMQDLGERLSKKIAPTKFEGENFLILDTPYKSFFNSLIHVASNIVDHGIEQTDVRHMLGKTSDGHVTFRTEMDQPRKSWFRITIEDDGAGIDREKIRARLIKNGIASAKDMDDATIFAQILQPNFSTSDTVTLHSGRGVGLNAVFEEVNRLDGQIRVESVLQKGTRFIIELPLID